nr:GNAT family N-acetyltransferase [Clostridium psychrophilum]
MDYKIEKMKKSDWKQVAEVSIYISEKYKGQGIGTTLLTSLIKLSEENGF